MEFNLTEWKTANLQGIPKKDYFSTLNCNHEIFTRRIFFVFIHRL